MIKIEHNVSTGKISEIELSDKEIKELQKLQAEALKLEQAAQALVAAQATAKAELLARLGITADEAKLLLA